jgi:hypothetical protein
MATGEKIAFALAEVLPGAPVLPALVPVLGEGAPSRTLFQDIPADDWRGALRLAEPGAAPDALLVPHHWRAVEKMGGPGYASRLVADARARGLPIVVVAYGDDHREVPVPAVVFRPSRYRQIDRPLEVSMPAYVEDLGRSGVPPVPAQPKPSVGFVGRAGFAGFADAARYVARTVFAPHPFKDGRWYRRAFARALAADPRVDANFIFRRRYSGHRDSIEASPEEARRGYLENLAGSAYGLAPKGDGNYSLRFYELLSLGRIPVLPDTGVVLPLEGSVRYDDFVVRVPAGRPRDAAEALASWHAARGGAGIAAASAAARAAFERYLYAPKFFAEATRRDRLAPLLARARAALAA